MADRVALAGFAAEHGLALTRFAYLLCGDRGRAEDLVQETYLALYRKYGDTLPLGAPVAYARKAIVNRHLARMRRRSSTEVPTGTVSDTAIVESATSGPTGPLWDRVTALPQRQHVAVICRYYLDLPDAEIARALGCRPASVRSLISRALTALRDTHRPNQGVRHGV